MDKEAQMRAVYMALVHDMGEALVGDITPHDGVSIGKTHSGRAVECV
jgi:5'-deoxynucleotidase YfbR-like HD superfamily hydrolase